MNIQNNAPNPDKPYIQLINELKQEIQISRIKAHLAVNSEMIKLYFRIGKIILEKQEKEGWGTKITQRVSEDLQKAFPKMKGLSYTNIRYISKHKSILPLKHSPDI